MESPRLFRCSGCACWNWRGSFPGDCLGSTTIYRDRNLVRAFYLALGVISFGAILVTLDFVNNYHKVNARLWSAAMVHDLAGISVQQNAKYLPQYIDPTNEISADDLKRMYSPLHANSLFDPGCRRMLGIANPSEKALHYQPGRRRCS